MAGTPLLDLGGLTKPATVLVEKITDAVGGLAKPWQIKRVARAEARAEVIRAEARIEISDLEERALRRLVTEEGRKQENIEAITAGAIPHIRETAKPEGLSRDWIAHFFERSRLASDVEMQALWSRILAGAANSPGAFSKKTIDLVATLEKRDAEIFMLVCQHVLQFRNYKSDSDLNAPFTEYQPCIIAKQKYEGGSELSFNNLTHLDHMGLIQFNETQNYYMANVPPFVDFVHEDIMHTVSSKNGQLSIGLVLFTRAGSELFTISGCSCTSENYLAILQRWSAEGRMPYCHLPAYIQDHW